jgi:hypothetical protein
VPSRSGLGPQRAALREAGANRLFHKHRVFDPDEFLDASLRGRIAEALQKCQTRQLRRATGFDDATLAPREIAVKLPGAKVAVASES